MNDKIDKQKKFRTKRKNAIRTHRTSLFIEQNCRCLYCRCPLTIDTRHFQQKNFATIDHIIPLAKGGSNNKSNLAVCCKKCNSYKNDDVLSYKELMYHWEQIHKTRALDILC